MACTTVGIRDRGSRRGLINIHELDCTIGLTFLILTQCTHGGATGTLTNVVRCVPCGPDS